MEILNLFINFISQILSFKILGFELINHIICLTIGIIIFKVIAIIGNSEKRSKK